MTASRRLAGAALVPVLLTCVVYGGVGRFGFVELDDPYYVYANQHLARDHGVAALHYAFTTFTGGNWHPLVWLSFFADRSLFGLRPGPMHLENAVLHAASGVLVLLLLDRATRSVGRATTCAALFAVHPAHVESVAWISERKDVLSTVWLLAATYAYVRYAQQEPPPGKTRWSKRIWYLGTIVCYAPSLSAKSMGVTLPAVLLLMDGWPLARLRGRVDRRVVEKAPLLLMAIAAAVLAGVAQRSVGATRAIDTTAGERVANAAVSYVRYLGDLCWPTGLAAFYPFRPAQAEAAAAAAVLLAVVTVVAVRVRRRRPYVLVGWLWFAGTLLPVCGLVQLGTQAMADRYTYFPSIGLSVAVVWAVADTAAAVAWAGPAIATAAVAALAIAGRRQAAYWRDDLTLFTRAADVTADNAMAYDHLGRAAIARGDIAAATVYLNRAIDADPSFAGSYADLGRCAAMMGQHGPAVEAFRQAVSLAPGMSSYRVAFAAELNATGHHAAAVAECRRAIEVDPASPTARDEWNVLTGGHGP